MGPISSNRVFRGIDISRADGGETGIALAKYSLFSFSYRPLGEGLYAPIELNRTSALGFLERSYQAQNKQFLGSGFGAIIKKIFLSDKEISAHLREVLSGKLSNFSESIDYNAFTDVKNETAKRIDECATLLLMKKKPEGINEQRLMEFFRKLYKDYSNYKPFSIQNTGTNITVRGKKRANGKKETLIIGILYSDKEEIGLRSKGSQLQKGTRTHKDGTVEEGDFKEGKLFNGFKKLSDGKEIFLKDGEMPSFTTSSATTPVSELSRGAKPLEAKPRDEVMKEACKIEQKSDSSSSPSSPLSIYGYGIDKESKRINLFEPTATDNKARTVAFESIISENSCAAIWQWIRLKTGRLVEHKITVVEPDLGPAVSGEKKIMTVLLNVNSLAKRYGISKERFKAATRFLEAAPQPKKQATPNETTCKHTAYALQEKFKHSFALVRLIATTCTEGADLSTLQNHEITKIIYKNTGQLGKGGFGVVYKVALTAKVAKEIISIPLSSLALKLTNKNLQAVEELKQLENEYKRLQEINPDGNAIGIQRPSHKISYGRQTGLLMTRYDGDLEATVPEEKQRSMITQLLTGLKTLHAKGFNHGDLKPGNVLVKDLNTDNPLFHISDFGDVINEEEQRKKFDNAVKKFPNRDSSISAAYPVGTTSSAEVRQENASTEEEQWKAVFYAKGTITPYYDPDLFVAICKVKELRMQLRAELDFYANFLAKQNLLKKESLEFKAIESRNFEGWREARKKADLFAMARTIKEKLCKPMLERCKPILNEMVAGGITAEEALERFNTLWESN